MQYCLSPAPGYLLSSGSGAHGVLGFLLGSPGFLECDLVFSQLQTGKFSCLLEALLPFEHFNYLFARLCQSCGFLKEIKGQIGDMLGGRWLTDRERCVGKGDTGEESSPPLPPSPPLPTPPPSSPSPLPLFPPPLLPLLYISPTLPSNLCACPVP